MRVSSDASSRDWLGNFSINERIVGSGLWNHRHVQLDFFDDEENPLCEDVAIEDFLLNLERSIIKIN
jgi:hypothetical protein